MILSPRLKAVAGCVEKGERIADIGTDHAYVPVYLLKTGIIEKAVASDVNRGPLEKARRAVSEHNICPESISLRLGSGLEPIESSEVDRVIIAGMGGELIAKILDENLEKARTIGKLVLQPMSQSSILRDYLKDHHFRISSEQIVLEEGKRSPRFYEILTAEPGEMEDYTTEDALFGYRAVQKRNEDFYAYVQFLINEYENWIERMESSENERTKRRCADFKQRLCFLRSIKKNESLKNSRGD